MSFPEAIQGDSSAQDDIDATRRYVGQDAEVIGGGAEHGHFTGARMNRAQRRKSLKDDERWVVSAITVTFENGKQIELDINKVMVIDKETKGQLFDYVLEAE